MGTFEYGMQIYSDLACYGRQQRLTSAKSNGAGTVQSDAETTGLRVKPNLLFDQKTSFLSSHGEHPIAGSEPALLPLLLVGQFSPRQREGAPGEHGFEFDKFDVVGRRFRVDHPGDHKMFFFVHGIYGRPLAEKQFLRIQLVKIRFGHDGFVLVRELRIN